MKNTGYVAPKEKYKAQTSAKKGSDKPHKKVKHSKPKTTKAKNSRAESQMAFYKGKGLKLD